MKFHEDCQRLVRGCLPILLNPILPNPTSPNPVSPNPISPNAGDGTKLAVWRSGILWLVSLVHSLPYLFSYSTTSYTMPNYWAIRVPCTCRLLSRGILGFSKNWLSFSKIKTPVQTWFVLAGCNNNAKIDCTTNIGIGTTMGDWFPQRLQLCY